MRYIALFCLLVFSPLTVMAQDVVPQTEESIVPTDPYTIANVVVDATADDAVKARQAAFTKGAETAVLQFLKLQGAPEELNGVDPDSLVRDFQVNEEHFSRTRYKAVLTYRFKPSAMGKLVNAAVAPEDALPIPEEAAVSDGDPTTPVTEAPTDYDQPWSPGQPAPQSVEEGVRSTPPQDGASDVTTWELTVSFDDVPQWLAAQNLIVARPEIRGLKMESMGANQARLTITTEENAASVQAKWQSLGWRVSGSGNGLSLDARGLGQ